MELCISIVSNFVFNNLNVNIEYYHKHGKDY